MSLSWRCERERRKKKYVEEWGNDNMMKTYTRRESRIEGRKELTRKCWKKWGERYGG